MRLKERKILSGTNLLLLALALGIIFGFVFKALPAGVFRDSILIDGVIKLLGTGFVNLIKMMVVPLVFVSLVCGMTAMGDASKMSTVGIKAIVFFMGSTAVAIILAIGAGEIFQPGRGLDMSGMMQQEFTVPESKGIVDVILDMIPTNPFNALVSGNMLQIIVFAMLVGFAINALGEKGRSLAQWFEQFNDVNMYIVELVMKLAPIGVFCLIANTVYNTGFDALISVAGFIALVAATLVVHAILVYWLMLRGIGRISAKPFFKGFLNIAPLAFSTASSNACLPKAMDMMDDLGVSRQISAFVLPVGATVNMNGTAIMQGVAAMFIAQIYQVDLSFNAILMLILTAVLAAVGTAGVPGVGMITLSMVLQSAGLPIEGIALIIGFDRILDMMRTTVNVMGDYVCTVVIAKTEGQLDVEKYNSYHYGE